MRNPMVTFGLRPLSDPFTAVSASLTCWIVCPRRSSLRAKSTTINHRLRLLSGLGFHTDQQISFYLRQYFVWSISQCLGVCRDGLFAWQMSMQTTITASNTMLLLRGVSQHSKASPPQALVSGITIFLKPVVKKRNVWNCVEWFKLRVFGQQMCNVTICIKKSVTTALFLTK